MLRVLIIGYGSIGRRHSKILNKMRKIGKIYILTKQKILNTKKIEKVNYNKFLNLDIDYIIVSNPSSLHFKFIKLIEKNFKNKKVLIEKPLFNKSHNLSVKKNSYYVGYNLRFHPVIKKIKDLIVDKLIWHIEMVQESFLPNWRKNINYMKSSTAKRSTGGGVLLELSHELDLAINIFGNLNPLFVLNTKKSDLKINTDDILIITGFIKSFNKNIIFNLTSNIFSKNLKREIRINGKDFSIIGDLINNTISYKIRNKEYKFKYSNLHKNQTYTEQHKAILNNNNDIICKYNEGIKVMNLISKIQKIKKLS